MSEIALASLLLVAAGLTLRSFQRVLNSRAGFHVDRIGRRRRSRCPRRATDRTRRILAAFDRIEERFAALPGVRAAGATSHLPLSGRDGRRGVGIEGREPTPDTPTRAHPRSVTPDYFQAMGITLLSGRGIHRGRHRRLRRGSRSSTRRWRAATGRARRRSGARVRLGGSDDWIEVVGVIADVKHWGLDAPVNPEMYFRRAPVVVRVDDLRRRRPAATPRRSRRRSATQLRAIDPNLPVSNVRTMEEVASVSVASRRAGMLLIAVFGALALVLAAAGIYGVMSHLVALRTAEIGVRMTLGARPVDVMALVLREGTLQALAGLAIGLTGGVLLMRTFQRSCSACSRRIRSRLRWWASGSC